MRGGHGNVGVIEIRLDDVPQFMHVPQVALRLGKDPRGLEGNIDASIENTAPLLICVNLRAFDIAVIRAAAADARSDVKPADKRFREGKLMESVRPLGRVVGIASDDAFSDIGAKAAG